MILTAHQPVYLPWLGLFHKIALADLFCYFDIVQYQKKDFNNRNKIKTSSGTMWLSVPVESKDHLQKNVSTISIVQDGWLKKHVRAIELNYRRAPFFDQYFEPLADLMTKSSRGDLGTLNLALLTYVNRELGISTPIVKASDYTFTGTKSDLVLNMCEVLGATTYIFGKQGEDYADRGSFDNARIRLHFQDYRHPEYSQINGPFQPFMSVIDLLFNKGPQSLQVILDGNATADDL